MLLCVSFGTFLEPLLNFLAQVKNSFLGNAVPILVQMMDDFRRMNELGFQLISSTDNGCATKKNDLENRYNPYFEIVLYKP